MDILKLDPGVIAAVIALATSIVINGLQFLSQRSLGKKAETEASSILIDMALKVNKQEMDTMRELISDLKRELKEKDEKIVVLENRTDAQEIEIHNLKRELEEYKRQLDSLK